MSLANSKLEPVAFTPAEFAALFSRSPTWGYRQLYAGRVTALPSEFGRILIPASEVERILATAGVYNGLKPKASKSKKELQKLKPKLRGAWRDYLARRSAASGDQVKGKSIKAALAASRNKREADNGLRYSALARLAAKSGKKNTPLTGVDAELE